METQQLNDNETQRLNSLAVEVPIDEIQIGQRIRRDFSHVPDLAESIKEQGLIQPIVLTYDKRLIAGESRIRACKMLGAATIRAVYRGVLDEAQLSILEATENTARQNLTWQERCLSVDKVHRLRSTNAALSGEGWGVRETGRLLGESKTHIGLLTFLAEFLHANDQEIWKAENANEAYRIIILRKEKEANKIIAAQTVPIELRATKYTPTPSSPPTAADIPDDEFFSGGSTPFAPGVSGPEETDERPGVPAVDGGVTIPLSQMLIHADAVEYLNSVPDAHFDHVITDWPYGIDMDHLNANNVHGGLKDIETVEAEHTVAGNMALHTAIVPALYRVLKPGGFFITWTDFMQWQRGYDLAVAAGFAVQRWPLVWHKTSACMNQTAQYNFTKNYEIAMVCRKEGATLIRPQTSSIWTGGNDIEAKALGHPFAKPFGLWNWLYDAVTVRGQRILEPFAGRGSAVIPAIRRGLQITAVESNPDHHAALIVNVSNLYKSLDPNIKFT